MMDSKIYFWGVLRPDGRIIDKTISNSKLVTSFRARVLCRKELQLPWKKVKKSGYRLVKLKAEIVVVS